MNGKQSDELISAFHDGELPPHEREIAVRLLEESPDAQRALRDYQGLSAALQGLPRHEAPPELVAAVMSRAERETLLAPPRESEPALAPSRSRRRAHQWVVVASGGALTAAALLLMVQTQWQSSPDGASIASRSLDRTESNAKLESATLASSDFTAPLADELVDERVTSLRRTSPANLGIEAGADDTLSFSIEADPAVERLSAGATPRPNELEFRYDPRTEPVMAEAEANDEIGHVIRYVEDAGESLSLVSLTARDVPSAAVELRGLLATNSVPVLDETAEGATELSAAPAPTDSYADAAAPANRALKEQPPVVASGRGEFTALYVEARSEQVVATLDAMRSTDFVVRIAPQSRVGQPDGEMRLVDQQFVEQLRGTRQIRQAADVAAAPTVRELSQGAASRRPPSARAVSGAPGATGRFYGDEARPAGTERLSEGPAPSAPVYQRIVKVTEDSLQQQQSLTPSELLTAGNSPEALERSLSIPLRAVQQSRSPNAPVRVLFLLQAEE